MKRTLSAVAVIIAFLLAGAPPAAAATPQRYIVRTTGGLTSILRLCLTAGCQVQGSLDGALGRTFLVTSTNNLVVNLLNGVTGLLANLLGITSVEPDTLLTLPSVPLQNPASGLSDTAPVNYYGTI